MRIPPKLTIAVLAGAFGALGMPVVAQAAITHDPLPELSAKLTAGVPVHSEVSALTFDQGHLWLAQKVAGSEEPVVDEFNPATGARSLQFPLPQGEGVAGIAVGDTTGAGQVYVGDGSGVNVFDETGGSLATWSGTDTPGGVAGFAGNVTGVAVDSSAIDPAHGDVYVADSAQRVVDVFEPKPAGGEQYLTQLTGMCASGVGCAPEDSFVSPRGVAVDSSNGDLLVADENSVDVFEPEASVGHTYRFLFRITGAPNGSGSFRVLEGVAVSPNTGEIYVWGAEEHEGIELVDTFVDEFSSTGEFVGRLTGTPSGPFTGVNSVAVDSEPGPAFEDLYVGDYKDTELQGVLDAFGGPLVVPDVVAEPVSEPHPTRLTFKGKVNPDGLPVTSCEFEYGTTISYGSRQECATSPGGGTSEVSVSAEVKPLLSGTTYYYRLVAGNEHGTNASQGLEVATTGPGIQQQWSTDVAATSATLEAKINPDSAPTSYSFEYDTIPYALGEAAHGTSVAGESIGEGTEPVQVSPRHIQGLKPNTPYYYRVVATSELNGTQETFAGPGATFTTGQAAGFALPDGRRWEQVSPVDKHGALLSPIGEAGVVQAAASGDAMTYLANIPTEAGVKGYFEEVQVLSERAAGGGWSSQDISLPHVSATGAGLAHGHEYRFFSEDLAAGIAEPLGVFTSLAPEVFPADTGRTPYVRHNATCGSVPARCYEPLLTAAPGYADVPEGTDFSGNPEDITGEAGFVGATGDLGHVVLSSGVPLTSESAGTGERMYEWSAGATGASELEPVSVLPAGEGGELVGGLLGERESNKSAVATVNARGAVSGDGSRVFWTSETSAGGGLYLRHVVAGGDGESVRLDTVAGGSGTGTANPQFQWANSTGSVAFFTDEQALTPGSGASSHAADLYECDVVEAGGKDECVLHDLTPEVGGQQAGVEGLVVGASSDGSTVYFVATGALSGAANGEGEKAVAGGNNLYVVRRSNGVWGAPVFIAGLSGQDSPDWGTLRGESTLTGLTGRVSGGGGFVVFMSNRSLTGYDNHDVVSGEPDEEVYLFDGEDGRLSCVSCDPTGARPVGVEDAKFNEGALIGVSAVWESSVWLAANVPGWTPYEQSVARHQSRYLSNEGRVFFNSSDALVPQDINNDEDVYEFEPSGVGSCSAGSVSGSTTYVAVEGGCVSLISSGTAAGESAFLDASENGNDVFFLTGEKLVPQDTDTALDVYDAHACTAESPCAPQSAEPPPCTTADACRVAPAAQPSIFGSPASSTFAGPGNGTSAAAVRAKAKPLTRAQKLAGALKVCRRDRKRARRVGCEGAARREYGPLRAKQKKKK